MLSGTSFTFCSMQLIEAIDILQITASRITYPAVTSKTMSLKETCLICFEETPIAQMFPIGTCYHKYCLSCMKRHVEVNLQNGIVAQCPHKRCKCEVNIETCKIFLSRKLADIMIQRIKECSIPATEKVYCAFPRCSALMSKKEVLEHTKSSFASVGGRKCMKCHRLFCINCKVPWHYDMNCYDYQRSETSYSLAEEQLLKSLAMKKLWRQCSKCKHMVELDSDADISFAILAELNGRVEHVPALSGMHNIV
ncbi:unnamed protein product [Prunus armeniaca]|uniref:RBR-type E3 ubiquitin transferase n=1 Tax=Prunus armeniaca TaxID=36596 RepID=A0A6J5XHA6_PRUAR|nr:unnamed protein product [Prunus armeniaca]